MRLRLADQAMLVFTPDKFDLAGYVFEGRKTPAAPRRRHPQLQANIDQHIERIEAAGGKFVMPE